MRRRFSHTRSRALSSPVVSVVFLLTCTPETWNRRSHPASVQQSTPDETAEFKIENEATSKLGLGVFVIHSWWVGGGDGVVGVGGEQAC